MEFFDWFNPQRSVVAASSSGPRVGLTSPPEPSPSREGVFVTPQSLTSFAGASFAVTAATQVCYRLVPLFAGNLWVPFICALLVGTIVFMINELDPQKTPKSRREWFIGVAVAFINSIVLFDAAIGAGALLTSA